MEELLLYTIFPFIAALMVFGVYRPAVGRSKGKSLVSYNLGTPCPDGVAATPCPHCGEPFGPEATEAARQKCERQLKVTPANSEGAGSFVDLIQRIWWNVICPSCGVQSSYVPQARILLHQEK